MYLSEPLVIGLIGMSRELDMTNPVCVTILTGSPAVTNQLLVSTVFTCLVRGLTMLCAAADIAGHSPSLVLQANIQPVV